MAERRASKRQSRRLQRGDWLAEGLRVLREQGEKELTVEVLCRRLEKTKGSFYHHFSGREDFVATLLEHWEQTFTRQLIADLEPVADPTRRLQILGERTAREVDLRLERTLRMWGEREPAAREVVERVDRTRERYLQEQLEAAIGDSHIAKLTARAHMAMLVGTQILYRDLSREALRELNSFIDHLGFDLVSERSTDTKPEPDLEENP